VVLLSVAAVLLFEIVVRTAKTAWKPTDVEVFQSLEKDADVNRRFEESSAAWLHQGWELDRAKAALHAINPFGGNEAAAAAIALGEEQKREKEVGEMLSKPRVMASIDGVEESGGAVASSEAAKAQEMFDRGYGTVRK